MGITLMAFKLFRGKHTKNETIRGEDDDEGAAAAAADNTDEGSEEPSIVSPL